jgi:hypothetical protein
MCAGSPFIRIGSSLFFEEKNSRINYSSSSAAAAVPLLPTTVQAVTADLLLTNAHKTVEILGLFI